MPVSVIRTAWAGTSGGPGITQLYVTEAGGSFLTPTNAQTAVNAVRTFWDGIKGFLPNELQLTVSPVVDSYNEINGELIGSTSAATAPVSVLGTEAGTFSMAAGIRVNLNTGVIRFGRRVRGGIYIVPASATAMSITGVVAAGVRTSFNTTGATMMSSLSAAGLPLVVYSRPRDADHPLGARPGAFSLVSAFETNEKGAVLRGRRD